MDYYTMCPEHGGSYGTTCEKCKIGEVERMATFVQLAMNEAREEAEQKCATLRARVVEVETQRDMEHCECDTALARVGVLESEFKELERWHRRAIDEANGLRAALRAMVDYFDTAEWRMVDAHEWHPLREAAMRALSSTRGGGTDE